MSRARARVRDAGGAELLARLDHLDGARDAPPVAVRAPDRGARPEFDVVIAGGGLSLLVAPLLADRGLRVAVVERARAGGVHREWNASGPELARLHESGLFTPGEVAGLVVARYREGVCRWHGGGAYPVRGVLDHAVDAGRLLAEVRRRALVRGVTILDGVSVAGEAAGPDAVAVRLEPGGVLTTKVLVDARGARSPYATADLVCPTVGGVLAGLEVGEDPGAIDPGVGEILATTDDVEGGRQHLWEAFPGRPGETTVYLFHYAPAAAAVPGALVALYDRFFDRLPDYKRGDARLIRPTFGHIPGWSRLTAAPRSPSPRILLFGDAAARHSPLTFCGFGAMLRTIEPAADALARALDAPRYRAPDLFPSEPIHGLTGALARLVADPGPGDPADLNRLLDAAFGTLHAMGDAAYAALLQDRTTPAEMVRFLRAVAARRPSVYREAWDRLGAAATARWGGRLAVGALA